MTVLLGLFLFPACIDDINRLPSDFPDNESEDFDGDGLTEQQGDCNDLDDDVEGPVTWYADTDGDGFGDPNVTIDACEQPSGYVGNSDDCLDTDNTVFPGNARFELADLCVLDADDDGFGDATPDLNVDSGTDCDDANPDVHPAAPESCDGIDNDCSGEVDDYVGANAPRWYHDADNDGHGDGAVYTNACTPPAGHVSDATDCDDANPDAYPNAPEYCDGIDTNCNGIDDDTSAQDASIWYADGDADGYGSSTSQPSCSQPEGHVAETGDCNDNNVAIHPDADEYCNTVDDDCDGSIDEGAAADAPTWYADLDGDGYGNAVVTEIACVASQGYVDSNTDCNDADAAVSPGADELCATDVDDDCDGAINEDDAVDPSPWYRDSDGDGYGDPQQIVYGCDPASNTVADNTDCDDGDATQNPNDGDNDGASTCDGDCNDADALLNISDADGDGVTTCDAVPDCNDGDAAVSPNANELCATDVDDDCDGAINESDAIDPNLWYADGDGDGYGDLQQQSTACAAPTGTVADNTDCDDADAAVSPAATEVCDPVVPTDNDCDGLIDDFDPSLDLSTGTAFYADADSDGFGNLYDTVQACATPIGYVLDDTDCDDGDPLQKPGGVEYCNSADDDCDGQIDEDDAVDRWSFFYDGDQDGHGIPDPGLMISSCPQPGGEYLAPTGYSLLDNDCNDGDAGISPSADELCTDTVDEDCDGDTTFAAVDFQTWYADSDGDGQGNGLYAIDLCAQPFGYVTNSLDCNDTDADVLSGMPEDWEICNGKLDRCEDDVYGDARTPDDERDDDGDGFVECDLGLLNPLLWEDSTASILGGLDCNDDTVTGSAVYPGHLSTTETSSPDGCFLDQDDDGYGDATPPVVISEVQYTQGTDCQDDDINAYPGASELCNGVYEDCSDPLYDPVNPPEDEYDDDGDCFVECSGFDANAWEGGHHQCEYQIFGSDLYSFTEVQGGLDCDDGNIEVFTGAGPNDPGVCGNDSDGDGFIDFNSVELWLNGQSGGVCFDDHGKYVDLDANLLTTYPNGVSIDIAFHWDGTESGVVYQLGSDDGTDRRIWSGISETNFGTFSVGGPYNAAELSVVLPPGTNMVSYRVDHTQNALFLNGELVDSGSGSVIDPALTSYSYPGGTGAAIAHRANFKPSNPQQWLKSAPFLFHFKNSVNSFDEINASEIVNITSNSVLLLDESSLNGQSWSPVNGSILTNSATVAGNAVWEADVWSDCF